MRTGDMRTTGSKWQARRLMSMAIALAMLLTAFAAHPPRAEAADVLVASITHVHDQGSKDAGNLSHRVLHHDHHAEMIHQLAVDFVGTVSRPTSFSSQDSPRAVQISLDRPPRAAWC